MRHTHRKRGAAAATHRSTPERKVTTDSFSLHFFSALTSPGVKKEEEMSSGSRAKERRERDLSAAGECSECLLACVSLAVQERWGTSVSKNERKYNYTHSTTSDSTRPVFLSLLSPRRTVVSLIFFVLLAFVRKSLPTHIHTHWGESQSLSCAIWCVCPSQEFSLLLIQWANFSCQESTWIWRM